jgi:predicted permease
VGSFTAIVALLAGVGIGLAPALQATRRNPMGDLKDLADAPHRSRAHGILVSAQIAISLILVTAAGLFSRSLWAVNRQEVGFDTDHLLLVECDLAEQGYSDEEARDFYRTLTDRLGGLPGVLSVARSSEAPLDRGWFSGGTSLVAGGEQDTRGLSAEEMKVTPEYFETLGLDLLAGRNFATRDDSTSALVAIVNEPLARALWPDSDPLGQQVRLTFILRKSEPVTVVGVAPGVRTFAREDQARPELLLPLAQWFQPTQWILLRVARAAGEVAPAVRAEIRRIDPDLPPPTVEGLAQRRVRVHSDERFYAGLTGAFGFIGVFFSALGLFGILSLEVSRRFREIGVRMTLGARPGQVILHVLGRGLGLALPGIGIGFVGALALTRLLQGLLFGVGAFDPVSFAGAATCLLAVTLGVSAVPALRASAVEPADLLRSE